MGPVEGQALKYGFCKSYFGKNEPEVHFYRSTYFLQNLYSSWYGTFIRWLKIPCDPHLEFCMSQHMFDTSKNNASLWVRKTCAKKEDCKATQGCKSLHNQTQVCALNQGQLKIWARTLPLPSPPISFHDLSSKGDQGGTQIKP